MSPLPFLRFTTLLGFVLGGVSAASAQGDIQPRVVGSVWQYRCFSLDAGERVFDGVTTERVTEAREVAGRTVYRVVRVFDWRTLADRLEGKSLEAEDYSYLWEFNDERGNHSYFAIDADDEAPEEAELYDLYFPFPVEVGHAFAIGDGAYSVLETGKVVTVPAGTFECIVYQGVYDEGDDPSEHYRERYFVSPGTGLVKWEEDAWVDGGWRLDLIDELTQYIPGDGEAPSPSGQPPKAGGSDFVLDGQPQRAGPANEGET